LASLPNELIENPDGPQVRAQGRPQDRRGDQSATVEHDVLSDVLRTIRLTGSLQFCFMPTGDWHTDDKPAMAKFAQTASGGASPGPSSAIPFHILVEGQCWLKIEGRHVSLQAGDVVAFPFGTGHQLGAGSDGLLVTPVRDLPPKPWRELPVLRYGAGPQRVRLLCGYLQCDAVGFRPLLQALPSLLHASTSGAAESNWLRATIQQIVSEVDRPRSGGLSMLERLTEITFIELLRHQIQQASPGATGWLAAIGDPSLGRCLALIHDDPARDWSLADLAAGCGLSRSSLSERFETLLDTSPMRYVRDWRLHLASVALSTSRKSIASIAHDAGYGTEAAFNRAFSRSFGAPPATWRKNRE
jgi:AraC-like DNA-binding protein